ncbi:MAG: UDP-N-acetylglucosamine--N-acetylmuramyl-(pentapeptide) pyrophosphoryl-undecaprenol N-acetylglucosamine transferase, partial [Phycisphaerales bacterium]|nr:UDP-N-acetylglucosamine--N-acetylmuramyl-(pentapeptide) pyrophosphoryl-undecaprenol N-acetylglucosamine transferase [Phycisphaerales bacterium]
LDAVPGKANLLVARFADQVCTALPVGGKQWTTLGPIVRAGTSTGTENFGLDPEGRTLLITGGSQGAESINSFVRAMVGHHGQAFRGWQIIHQTGKGGVGDLPAVYERAGIRSWVGEYINDMESAWAMADLTIGRCGAGTVAEAWAANVPAVLLPYPYHKDQHQKHNAMVLVDVGAGIVFDDRIDATVNIQEHGKQLAELLVDPSMLSAMHAGFARLGGADGARAAAGLLDGFRV